MSQRTTRPAIPIISEAADLMARYDVVFCDIWGVVHDGVAAYAAGCERLRAFRQAGGTVVLVSNAPRRAETVGVILSEKSVPRESWDAIMSSGEISVRHIAAAGIERIHHLGPDRDLDLFETVDAERVALEDAEAIVATGLINDRIETGDDYRARLLAPAEKGVPLICANPDLVVDVGGTLLPCAGAIATVYADLGGPVFWAGKPHADAYEAAHARAEELRGETVAKSRILAIGDAERTDVAGAHRFGVDALFIGQGIHRDTVMRDPVTLRGAQVEELFADHDHRPVAAMATLA